MLELLKDLIVYAWRYTLAWLYVAFLAGLLGLIIWAMITFAAELYPFYVAAFFGVCLFLLVKDCRDIHARAKRNAFYRRRDYIRSFESIGMTPPRPPSLKPRFSDYRLF